MIAIAIVGMACRYADARNPQELWENVLARRRAFRRMPPERLLLSDYFSADPETPDAIYATHAALLEGYEFDRVRFRVAGPAFRSVDMAHWLALDVAAEALADAGFANGEGLPLETTGVLVGNTLTGEFSRAATMRLRWPYVRRVVEAGLRAQGWDQPRRSEFLRAVEDEFKSPFAPVGEETLAGALSNTIAGRICNHFHLGGGGYTLDGACCSSLLAVARACSALETGEIDVALAGGVDLSLDPFELVGFAKAGALARGEMLVYDRDSTGFLPGEGSGFVLLMRDTDAQTCGLRSYAVIRGWGLSSDGGGSITRPEIRGQTLALQRAYQRAGYGPETVALFEGHGTGTPVGDAVELQALTAVRRAAATATAPAAIASIKANIGHTKAAAGVAGLIKAALAVHHQVVPPATGVVEPRPELKGEEAALRIAEDAEPWPQSQPVRAGVNSFGFGGINVHVTMESGARAPAAGLSPRAQLLSGSAQDAELFLFAEESQAKLAGKLEVLARLAAGLSYSEMADSSAVLAADLAPGAWRAAIVASSPQELAQSLESARSLLKKGIAEGARDHLNPGRGIFIGWAASSQAPRIGLLFPGQASPVRLNGGAHGRRFASARELYRATRWPDGEDANSTHAAQVAIATAEIAGLRMLNVLGIEATVAVGHSLGELVAYGWAGAIDEASLRALVDARGRSMAKLSGPPGAMASISATSDEVEALLREEGLSSVAIACFNTLRRIVVAGATDAVERLLERVQARGWSATRLQAAHAFHSPLMLPAVASFQESLDMLDLRPLQRRVVSTITGTELVRDADLRRLLAEQLTAPVRFVEAMAEAATQADLWIEVGPGQVLTNLVEGAGMTPVIAMDVAGSRLAGVLEAAAAAHVLGSRLRTDELFQQRFTRPFDFQRVPRFFVNPCELAPASDDEEAAAPVKRQPIESKQVGASNGQPHTAAATETESAVQVVRSLLARRTELPPESIAESAHLLRDLHLNSIVVGEIVAAAARRLGMAPPRQLLEFADATVGQTAQALDRLRANASGAARDEETMLAGVDDWQRPFVTVWQPSRLRRRAAAPQTSGAWRCFAPREPALAEAISRAALPGSGVIAWLRPGAVAGLEKQAELLFEAARASLEMRGQKRYFVVVGESAICSAFARTLHLEDPDILTRIIEAPAGARAIDMIRDEVTARGDCIEAHYDDDGARSQLCWRLLEDDQQLETPVALGPGDVVVVSGGGKGIVAECCRMLAVETAAALIILGRSRPESDAGVAAQLDKLERMGVRATYFVADVTDSAAVRAAVSQAEAIFGPVTAILHGAGRNQPRLLRDLDRHAVFETLAPKVQGLCNLLAAVDPGRLRLLVTFGSVIGRAGLRGEADYALANAFQSRLTEDFAREHPACRCLAFESSAWSGTGMAERLGTLETLRRAGIAPIPAAQGVLWLRRLLSRRLPAVSVVLTGRLGANPPLPIAGPSVPLLRFLEKPRVFYPGVELVGEAELTTASDPYLMDHVFESQPLLPGVIALEAMVQAATAVTGEERLPVLSSVRFERPLVVQPGTRVTVRVAALVRETGSVDVVVRSSQTLFQVDHFRCTCDFREPPPPSGDGNVLPVSQRLAVDPEKDLYGRLLFQAGRFRRLAGYRLLNARACCAEIAASENGYSSSQRGHNPAWFSQYLPGALLLGDPGARDAALHAVQACVPHALLLPVGVKRLYAASLNAAEELLVFARRRWREGKTYCYDVELRSRDGVLRERWEELELRQVAEAATRAWPDPLVAAYLEWRVEETVAGCGVAAAFDRDRGHDRRLRSERAIQKALDSPQPVSWRADGKPEVQMSAVGVSAAHSNGLTLAVAGPSPVACDLEPVCARSDQVWRDLLGREHWSLAELIAVEAREDLQTAATRVWTALESLRKAEAPADGPLVLLACSQEKQGCVSLAAHGLRIATSIVHFRDDPTPFAVSVLARSNEWVTTNTGTASALKRPTL
jgi:enediyne polyketide synthase